MWWFVVVPIRRLSCRQPNGRSKAEPIERNGSSNVVALVQSNKLFLIGHKMTTNDLVAISTPDCLQVGKIYINLDNGKLKVY